MSRYPAPHAEQIWSDEARAHRMREISDVYAAAAARRGLLLSLAGDVAPALGVAPDVSVGAWKIHEAQTGHEIVGFLQAYLNRLPRSVHPFVHYGLTSSDLVEYDLHLAIDEHARAMEGRITELAGTLARLIEKYSHLSRAGRTHGQTAEMTNLGHQFRVFHDTLLRHRDDLDILLAEAPVKSPGPTGISDEVEYPGAGQVVASTQILPRDFLFRWAAAYLNLSNTLETMAMFVRLGSRSEIGELREGSTKDRQGSSAMPGKANPIESEKVCGLARVSRGHFLALSEVSALWEDRDLSNSSTERLAVPGLAANVEHMVSSVTRIFEGLVINEDRIRENASDPRCQMNARQREIQRTRLVGPIEASRLVTEEEAK